MLQSFPLALLGRFVFGLGAENLVGKCQSVSQSYFITKWFQEYQIALIFGIIISFSRLVTAT
jgi:hypothetical protein